MSPTIPVPANLHELDDTQRAMEAARVPTLAYQTARSRGIEPITIRAIAAAFGVSTTLIDRARFMRREASPELIKLAEAGGISIYVLERVAGQWSHVAQDLYVARVRAGFDANAEAPPWRPAGGSRKRRTNAALLPGLEAQAVIGVADALAALGQVLATTEGISSLASVADAARWAGDIGKNTKHITRLMRRLKEHQG